MAETEERACCRGARVADSEELTKDAVRAACRDGIRSAIETQLDDADSTPIVIDGLPTIGKTHQASRVAAELDEQVAILTHRYETRDDHLAALKDHFEGNPVEIPTFDRTCPTKRGEHGERWKDRLSEYRARGASPTYLHHYFRDTLPCMDGKDCPYLVRRDAVESADVVIGGPAHAGLEEVVEDRVVIFDEDPQETYQTEFDASDLAEYVSAFLANRDELPIDNYEQLRLVAGNKDGFTPQHETIRDFLTDSDSLDQQTEAIRDEGGHVEAPTAVFALLELDGPTIGEASGHDWDDTLRSEAQLDYAELPDGASVVYDQKESRLVVRRAPDLSGTRAVVGLDGTPVEQLWKGRLGADDIELWRVLCNDCRKQYLTEVVGYTFVQTTTAAKPYSSGEHVNENDDYGLIEGVANQHETKPSLITSRAAEDQLFENASDEPFVDTDRVTAQIEDSKHYGNLRSSNDFEGTDVGIILGSPHPGDRAIQITAALEGYTAVRDEQTKGTDLDYGIPDQPFLHYYREHKVAQAVLRFGRTSPATVYIHTSAIPEWLAEMVAIDPSEVDIRPRREGERSILHSLHDDGPGTAGDIASRDAVTVGEKHTRDCLKRLHREGVVERDDTQPYCWQGTDLGDVPHTAAVDLPESNDSASSQ